MSKEIQELLDYLSKDYDALVANYEGNGKNDYDAGKVEGFKIAMEEIQSWEGRR